MRSRLLALALAVGLGVVCAACGPSFQAVYECDVRFEHCYALDQQPSPNDAKKECWRDWLHGYTYGQPRDRVEYAAARFSELSLDRMLPAEEDVQRRVRSSAVPAPTSAFAPPPGTAEHPLEAAPETPVPRAEPRPAARAPGEECASACAGSWKACHELCRGNGCESCDRTYRACVPRCIQAGPRRAG